MTGTLDRALLEVCLRLEQGLAQAEQELATTRERCTKLELVVRTIRAQRSELALLERADLPLGWAEPAVGRGVIEIPEAMAEPTPAPDAGVEEPAPAPDPAPEEVTEIPTSYMPMLEELWDIARHADRE